MKTEESTPWAEVSLSRDEWLEAIISGYRTLASIPASHPEYKFAREMAELIRPWLPQ